MSLVGQTEAAVATPRQTAGPRPPRSSTAALATDAIAKRFGDFQALRGVSIDVQPGERLALLGPNGAGKTTLARCLCGTLAPDSGHVELLGRRLPTRGGRQPLGFVPQELAVYPDLTTRENLHAFGRFNRLRGRELRRRIDWALEWTGLADRANELVKTFSGGMKRRVNMACGVLHDPKVLLLDEPTVGVDPQSRQRIFEMLDELRDAGAAIVLTTHHLEEAEQRCDRIVILDRGAVIAQGSLAELVDATIGPERQVHMQLAEPIGADRVPGFRVDPGGRVLRASIADVARDLPTLIDAVHHAGGDIADVEVHAPTLHAVFLHLTGRELRE
ncbi:MAG: ABC transporter ATP-binding protein [Planctomycetota bacterium]